MQEVQYQSEEGNTKHQHQRKRTSEPRQQHEWRKRKAKCERKHDDDDKTAAMSWDAMIDEVLALLDGDHDDVNNEQGGVDIQQQARTTPTRSGSGWCAS